MSLSHWNEVVGSLSNGEDAANNMQNVSADTTTGMFSYTKLDQQLARFPELPRPSGAFLGLGAGSGAVERQVAQHYGASKITFVDIQPVEQDDPAIEYVADDLFHFLETTDKQFGFISLYGLDVYEIFDDVSIFERLVSGIARVSRSGAYIFVSGSRFDEAQVKAILEAHSLKTLTTGFIIIAVKM